ncbi:hypothetical protein B0A55_06772 [Friedmanniomyces simplex]|uniref:Amino acid permease/ SLC12A domain-containing protein n=1 Tax=Friedmanniomyces simplex TaxID=329884 RepID=A0A4U0X0B7_9PEZI|nr:hypothetical protein B0A55_06772 [Friedmanniomyces simplex]
MTAVILVAVMMANFGLQTGGLRTAWAFARDKGLPASGFLEHSLLGLINVGSTAAFNPFVNSAAVTLYITYITSVVLIVLKCLREPIPYGPFSLGKLRNPIDAVAILYIFFTSFYLIWPALMGPTATTMTGP